MVIQPIQSVQEAQDRVQWVPASFPLDQVIGNLNGKFVWGFKRFSQSAQNITLNGTVLSAELKAEDGTWKPDTIDLDLRFMGRDGVLTAVDVPALVGVPEADKGEFLGQLGEALDKDPDAKLVALKEPDGKTTFVLPNKKSSVPLYKVATGGDEGTIGYAAAKAGKEDEPNGIFTALGAEAVASVFHVAQQKGRAIETLDVNVGSVKVGATIAGIAGGPDHMLPTYVGADASINLLDAKASVFDLKLGVGVETGAGIKDGSLDGHVLGCGFTFGKKMSISVFGNSIGIDIGRFF